MGVCVCSTFSWSNNCLFCVNFEWAFKMIKFHFINILQLPEKDINFNSISVRSVANFKAVTTLHVHSGPPATPLTHLLAIILVTCHCRRRRRRRWPPVQMCLMRGPSPREVCEFNNLNLSMCDYVYTQCPCMCVCGVCVGVR